MVSIAETESSQLVVVLGLPCSGKTRFIEETFASKPFVWLAIDRIARQLPEYKPTTAVLTYEEAAVIGAKILTRAFEESARNIVVETVGRERQTILRIVLSAKRLGYETELCWLRLQPLRSAKRSMARFKNPDDQLFIDPAYILRDLNSVPGYGLIESGVFDKWSIWETNKDPDGDPKLLRSGAPRPPKKESYRGENGIDWGRAWEDALAGAAEKVMGKMVLNLSVP